MRRLPSAVKIAIVQGLARNHRPSEVARFIKAEFGINVAPSQAARYDPRMRAGGRLGAELVNLFIDVRARTIAEAAKSLSAYRVVRVRLLAEAARRAQAKGADVAMMRYLEWIAIEMGGV